MFYKPSFVLIIIFAYLALVLCLDHSQLIAKNASLPQPSPIPPFDSTKKTSNLISNNPFIPKNNGLINQPSKPTGPQSITNSSKVLQKYLQFKSIAIINKKKYFSIFNKRTNKAFWISEGETVENFRVTFFNPTSNTISITDGINSEIISLITASETPLKVASSATIEGEKVTTPQIPGADNNQNKEKTKTPPRRRVIPVKR